MEKNYKLQNILRKELKLAEERARIFKLPEEKIINAILDYEQPASLVQSISKEDFYFLIHEIGPEDCLAIIALADASQWEYILDLEIWNRDRIDMVVLARWFELLHHADRHRLVRWLATEKSDFFEYCLFQNIEVRIRDEDETSSDFGDEYFTLDDIYYVRFKDDIHEDDTIDDEVKEQIKKSRDIISGMIHLLAEMDHMTYQKILLEAMTILPSEVEENIYRLKNVRLAEKGFLPYDDALGVYSPIKIEEIEKGDPKIFPSGMEEGKALPTLPIAYDMRGEDNYFAKALALIHSEEILNYIQIEFATLCNQIISADQRKIRGKDGLLIIMDKAHTYLSIGLEAFCSEKEVSSHSLSDIIKKHTLIEIFRFGYSKASNLKFKAEKWVRKSWFKSKGLPIGFWGEEQMGMLGGLLLQRPMFFDNYENGLLYREFKTIEEIRNLEDRLEELMDYDDLFSLISIDFSLFPNTYLNYKNLLLTLWACHYLEIENGRPLSIDELKDLFSVLWAEDKKDERHGRSIKISMKESFLNWLSNETGLKLHEISQRMAETLEVMFGEIEAEYGAVSIESLDPKYIHLFCLKDAGGDGEML